MRILPGIVAVRERPYIQRSALSRFGELQGGTAEGRMSVGLRRVPSFSGRPGFPNGLRVLPFLYLRIKMQQLRRIPRVTNSHGSV